MLFKRFFIIIFLILGLTCWGYGYEALQNRLNWVSTQKADNLCQGYYIDEPIHFLPDKQLSNPEQSYNINADDVSYSLKGPSVLSGHVVLSRPKKRFKADKVWLYRNDTPDHALSLVKAKGHLQLSSPGQLMVAKSGQLNLQDKTFSLQDADYRVSSQPDRVASTQKFHGKKVQVRDELHYRGHSSSIQKVSDQHYVLKDATLTTCPPSQDKSCAWHIKASTVKLDTKKGEGHAYNTLFWFHGAPIFYTPYATFPLNDKRKSGFLYPSFGRKNDSEFLAIPYYFNLAPNYDLTLTPQYYTRRGGMLGGQLRYLNQYGNGELNATFMPEDRHFRHFKDEALQKSRFQSRPQALERLADDDNSRYALRYHDQFEWGRHWFSQIHFNQVSDDYYIQDFGESLINNSDANLLQKAQLQYQGSRWNVTGFVQGYQTLHPINRSPNSNQYSRLPELQATGDYAGIYPQLDPSIDLQSVYFHKYFRPDKTSGTPVNGERVSVEPDLQYDFRRPYGYIKPELHLQLTQYWLDHNHQGLDQQASNAVPTFDVHSKLNFERFFSYGQNNYEQTLEPELFYVFTPHVPQDNVPIFDTSERSFNYNYLFHSNRFSGVDRVGDTNRMTLALTSRLLNANTGNEKAAVSIGDIVYFRDRKVTHCTGHACQPGDLQKRDFSPIVAKGSYQLAEYWQGKAQAVWNPYADEFSREQASLEFEDQPQYLFNVGYKLIRNGGVISGGSGQSNTRLKELKVGGAWKVNPRWRILGHMGYSWAGNNSENHGKTYLAGVEYNSCCWGLRLVGSRSFEGLDDQNHNRYDNTIYLQVFFKGLGSVGNRDASSELSDNVSNYSSEFNTAGIL